MTRKEIIELADVIRSYQESKYRQGDIEKYEPFLIDTLSQFCIKHNPNFKPALFLAYIRGECKANGGKIK